jgi:type IV fimbrial biogenesis protein FimT
LKILTKKQQSHSDNTTRCDVEKTEKTAMTDQIFCQGWPASLTQNHAISVQKAFTLVELMAVILIASVLVMSAIASHHDLMQWYDIRRFIAVNDAILSDARSNALLYHSSVLVCGSSNGQFCDHRWHQGVVSFIDRDANQNFNQSVDTLLQFEPLMLRYGQVTWRGFGNRSVIVYDAATGTPNASNGTLTYCSDVGFQHRQLILSRMGRVRESKDTNQDGRHENAAGQPIQCR